MKRPASLKAGSVSACARIFRDNARAASAKRGCIDRRAKYSSPVSSLPVQRNRSSIFPLLPKKSPPTFVVSVEIFSNSKYITVEATKISSPTQTVFFSRVNRGPASTSVSILTDVCAPAASMGFAIILHDRTRRTRRADCPGCLGRLAESPCRRRVPYIPTDDSLVLQRVLPNADPRISAIREKQATLAQHPGDADLALDLASHQLSIGVAEADPRFVGYAQGTLAPWWREPEPPVPASGAAGAHPSRPSIDFPGGQARPAGGCPRWRSIPTMSTPAASGARRDQ